MRLRAMIGHPALGASLKDGRTPIRVPFDGSSHDLRTVLPAAGITDTWTAPLSAKT